MFPRSRYERMMVLDPAALASSSDSPHRAACNAVGASSRRRRSGDREPTGLSYPQGDWHASCFGPGASPRAAL